MLRERQLGSIITEFCLNPAAVAERLMEFEKEAADNVRKAELKKETSRRRQKLIKEEKNRQRLLLEQTNHQAAAAAAASVQTTAVAVAIILESSSNSHAEGAVGERDEMQVEEADND
jgi:hypothetical protein